MRVPHVVVDGRGHTAELAPETDRHLRRVLRLRDGAAVSVTDGHGGLAAAVLVPAGLEVQGWSEAGPPPVVNLWAAIGKRSKFDLVVEKATELGAASVVPLLCGRGERQVGRTQRWEAIARAAVEQSRGVWLPRIAEPAPFADALVGPPGVLLHPGARGGASDLLAARPSAVAVGPEGGFTPDEVDAAFDAGWTICGLGPRILRTETAAVVALALAVASGGGLDSQDPPRLGSNTPGG